jgi:hypothetical protein
MHAEGYTFIAGHFNYGQHVCVQYRTADSTELVQDNFQFPSFPQLETGDKNYADAHLRRHRTAVKNSPLGFQSFHTGSFD